MILSFAIFDLTEFKSILINFFVPILMLIFSHVTGFSFTVIPFINLNSSQLVYVAITMCFLSILVTFLIIYSLTWWPYNRAKKISRDLIEKALLDEERFKTIIENIPSHSIIMLDMKGLVVTWNSGAEKIKGYSSQEAIGLHYSNFFLKEDQEAWLPEIILKNAEENGKYFGKGWRKNKSGKQFWCNFSISAIWKDGKVIGFTKILQDLTKEKRKEDQLALRLAAEHCLGIATNEGELIQSILKALTNQLGWQGGGFWKLNTEESCLEYSHYFGEQDAQIFAEETKTFRFPIGKGLPGRAWESHQIVWMEDADSNFPRQFLAQKSGITTGFAAPIEFHGHFFGCIVFFNSKKEISDPMVIDVFKELSGPIAQRIQYFRSYQQAEERKNLLQSIIDGYKGLIAVQSIEGPYLMVNQTMARAFGRKPEEIIENQLQNLDLKDAVSGNKKEVEQMVDSGKPTISEISIQINGISQIHSITRFPIYTVDGKINAIAMISLDMTENSLLRDNIKESLDWQNAILEGANQSIISTDCNGTILTFNHKAELLLGYKADEIIGKTNPALIHIEDEIVSRAAVLSEELGHPVAVGFDTFIAKAKLGFVDENEWTYVRKDGSRFPVLLSVTSLKNAQNKITGYLGIATDLTEKNAAIEELNLTHLQVIKEKQKSDSILRALDETAMVSTTNKKGKITSVNDKFCEISGYKREELVGKNHRVINSKNHPKSFFIDMWKTISYGKIWHDEVVNRKKNGQLYWVSSTIVPKKDLNGKIEEFIAIRFDITKQKETENQLLNIANSMPALISHWDRGLRNRFSNQAVHDWFAISSKEIETMTLPQLLGDVGFQLSKPFVKGALSGIPQQFERELTRKKDGSVRNVITTYIPDKVGDEVQGIFICVQDITDLKAAEAAAKEGQEKALIAASAKSQFLAHMSHEIRTPLNGIIGMTDLLMETHLSEEQKKYTKTVANCGEALLEIVNDVLDYSKIEAGKLEIEKIDYSPKKILEERVDMLSARAQAKGISILSFISNKIPDILIGDSARIGQILLNLIGNAIKFTEKGSVTCQIHLEDDNEHFITLRFEVTDTGIGLNEAQKNKLFQSFTQADSSMSRRFGGTGLGLVICKKIVEAMGGEIGVLSTLGEGSTFWFKIPQQKKETHSIIDRKSLAGISLYTITEDMNLKTFTQKYCAEWGLGVEILDPDISNIKNLIGQLSQNKLSQKIIFIDAATDHLKELAKKAYDFVDPKSLGCLIATEKEMSYQDVFFPERDGIIVLQKPFHQSEFFNGIMTLSGLHKVSELDQSKFQSTAALETQTKKIMVAEDNLINQQLIQKHLEILGYQTLIVGNGAEAVAESQTHSYDLILMDCQMPIMDGYTATREIRKHDAISGAHTLIIALTANATTEDRQACINAGMDDVLTKPIKRDRLEKMFAKWFGETK
jgi:PAS domain S-box-containing protein